MGWIKGNFDGSAKGNLGKARCGGVLRDHYSRVVDTIAILIGKSTSHKVEATTALFTMRIEVEFSFWNLCLEGDSLNIINMLNNKSLITQSIEGSISEIKYLMNKFDNVYISHIFWQGNKVADQIANQAVYRETKLSQKDDLSKEVELTKTINYDMTHANEGKIMQD